MSFRIQSNVSAVEMARSSQKALETSAQRQSGGYRQVTAAPTDVSQERIRSQLRSLAVAEQGASDGLSAAQSAESALTEQSMLLGRLRDVALMTSQASVTALDSRAIESERAMLTQELDRAAQGARLNGTSLLTDSANGLTLAFQAKVGEAGANLSLTFSSSSARALGVDALDFSSAEGGQRSLEAIETALQKVNDQRGAMVAFMGRAGQAASQLDAARLSLSLAPPRLRDVGLAEENASQAANQVLTQAGAAVLAQSNSLAQTALGLLK